MIRTRTSRGRIIREIREKTGYGKCKSERVFRAVFDVMKASLRRGEEVDLPFGTLIVEKAPERTQDIRTMVLTKSKQVKTKIRVLNKRKKRVRLIPKILGE